MDSACYYSPLGVMQIFADNTSLKEVKFIGTATVCEPTSNPILNDAIAQLAEYFAQERKAFDLPLAPEGTPFQKQIWTELRHIPFGHKKTYGEVAGMVKSPSYARVVGTACNKNPLPILIPCHRVIGQTNPLAYACGGTRKEMLLEHEGIEY